jgi:hypothetical protein
MDPFAASTRVTLNQKLVDKACKIVNNNILLTFLRKEVLDCIRLATGVPKIVVGDQTFETHPSVVRTVRGWMEGMQQSVVDEFIKYGGFLVRLEPTQGSGAPPEAATVLKQALAEVIASMSDRVGGGKEKRGGGAGKVRSDITAALEMEEGDVSPELQPVIVPLEHVVLSYRFENGVPVDFQARWRTSNRARFPNLSSLGATGSDGDIIPNIMFFAPDGTLNRDGTFNSHATVSRFRIKYIEALLYQYARVANGRARPVALSMHRDSMKPVNGSSNYDEYERYSITERNATEAITQRAEEDKRRKNAVEHLTSVENKERDLIAKERENIRNDDSINEILRDDPDSLLHNHEVSGARHIVALPTGDTIGAMPLPETVPEIVEMIKILMSDIAMVFGARLGSMISGGGSGGAQATAESVRHERESFRHHVNGIRDFCGRSMVEIIQRVYVNHLTTVSNKIAHGTTESTRRRPAEGGADAPDDAAPARKRQRWDISPKLVQEFVQHNVRITIVFAISVDLPFETLRELLLSSVIGPRNFVRSAISLFGLPEEFYEDYLENQEMLVDEAKAQLKEREEQARKLEEYSAAVAKMPADGTGVPPPVPFIAPKCIYDLQNERRVRMAGVDRKSHLGFNPDPIAFLAGSSADLAALFAPLVDTAAAMRPGPPNVTAPKKD